MSNITCLVIGDPHFKVKNLSDCDLMIRQVRKVAIRLKPTFIVCLGDLLDTHEKVHTQALNKAWEFMTKLASITTTLLIVGNHDYINNTQFLTGEHPFNSFKKCKNLTVVDRVVELKIKDEKDLFYFVFLPYVYPGRFKEALNGGCKKDWTKATCIFSHQEFKGCKMGAIVSEMGDKWNVSDPFTINGHIHDYQRPQKNIIYTGSLIQHSFGESEDKTIGFVTFVSHKGLINKPKKYDEIYKTDNFSAYYEKINLNLPTKKIIYMNTQQIEKYEFTGTDGDRLKIKLSGTYDEFRAFKRSAKSRELENKGVRIAFLHNKKTETPSVKGKDRGNYNDVLRSLILDEDNDVQTAYNEIFPELSISKEKADKQEEDEKEENEENEESEEEEENEENEENEESEESEEE